MDKIGKIRFLNLAIVILNVFIVLILNISIYFAFLEFGIKLLTRLDDSAFFILHLIVISISSNRIIVLLNHLKTLNNFLNSSSINRNILDINFNEGDIGKELLINRPTRNVHYLQFFISIVFLGLIILNFDRVRTKEITVAVTLILLLSEILTSRYFKNCFLRKY